MAKKFFLFFSLFFVSAILGLIAVFFVDYIWLIFAFLLFFLLLLFALRFPFYTFILFIISLPFEAAFVAEVGFTIRISYILLAIILLAVFFSGKKLFLKSPLNVPIFIFLSVSLFSLVMTIIAPPPSPQFSEITGFRGSQFRSVIQFFFLLFFASSYFLTIHFCFDIKKIKKVLLAYIGVACAVSCYGIYQFFAIRFNLPFVDITNAISTSGKGYGALYWSQPELFRPHATFQEPLNFGNYILSILPLLLALLLLKAKNIISFGSQKLTLLSSNLVFILPMLIVLILSKSRGALIGFVAAICILFFWSGGLKRKMKLVVLFVLFLMFFSMVLVVFVPEYSDLGEFVFYRFRSDALESQSIQSRVFPSSTALTLLSQYPLLGIGIGNYGLWKGALHPDAVIGGGQSLWAQILTETGILGFSAFLFLIFVYLRTILGAIKKARKTFWHPYFIGYLACFIGMMVQYLASFDRFPLYFWVFLGISMASFKLMEKDEKKYGTKNCRY